MENYCSPWAVKNLDTSEQSEQDERGTDGSVRGKLVRTAGRAGLWRGSVGQGPQVSAEREL